MNSEYSVRESYVKLKRFKRRMEKSRNKQVYDRFNVIKDAKILQKCLNAIIFKSKNTETNEMYDIKGRSFESLFGKEWLHCDVIDIYLNEWRRRIGESMNDPLNKNVLRVKIYNTLLYTRLTRGIKFSPSRSPKKLVYNKLRENANRISREKIYHSSTLYSSIFDFDILIVPIHVDDHWISGIIYKPKNCLFDIQKVSSDLVQKNNDHGTYILIFDSMVGDPTVNKSFCDLVLKEYIHACFNTWKEKFSKKNWDFDENKITIIELKDLYQQNNDYDCGIFMLEFIRQILLNPKSLDDLIKGEPMTRVFPGFNVNLGRSYLKTFIYSKVNLKEWIVLYEMERHFFAQHYRTNIKRLRSRSVDLKAIRNNNIVRSRSKSCGTVKYPTY